MIYLTTTILQARRSFPPLQFCEEIFDFCLLFCLGLGSGATTVR